MGNWVCTGVRDVPWNMDSIKIFAKCQRCGAGLSPGWDVVVDDYGSLACGVCGGDDLTQSEGGSFSVKKGIKAALYDFKNQKYVPKGATHRDHTGLYWDFPKSLVWVDGVWQKDTRGFALIFTPLALLDATHENILTGDFYKKVGTYWEKWLGEWVSVPFPPINELRELNK